MKIPRSAFYPIVGVATLAVFLHENILRTTGWPIGLFPFALNVLILSGLIGALLAVTDRVLFSIGASLLGYLLIGIGDFLKLRYLLAPAHPADLFSISELFFIHLLPRRALGSLAVCGGAALIGLAWTWHRERSRLRAPARVGLLLLAAAMVGIVGSTGRVPSLTAFFRAGGVSFYTVNPLESAQRNGLLLNLLVRLRDLQVDKPDDYGPAALARIKAELGGDVSPAGPTAAEPVSLVIYVIEALMDPADLGWQFTADPIPFLRRLMATASAGWIYSPEFGGRSANAEFELLTGLATAFLPPESVAYNQFISRSLPALPRFLGSKGYRSAAFHVDTLSFFNYPVVYERLGFGAIRTLHNTPGVPLDAAGRIPSDDALVDLVIEQSQASKPFFLFAFTNSTHMPYDYPAYLDSDLDVVDRMPDFTRRKTKTYINAIRTADRAAEKLIAHFERFERPVVVAILGDHLPALDADGFANASFRRASSFVDGMALSHRCPAIIWSNVATGKRDFDLSLNFLAQRLLKEMNLSLDSYWTMNAAVASRLPVVSRFVQSSDGNRFLLRDLPESEQALLEAYRLLQYDVLFGEQFLLESNRN